MSKINIIFNEKSYSIDESVMSDATQALQNHLSNSMSGSGAVINLGGNSYNVDSAKLMSETNQFINHLATLSGSGSKVVINGVEYSIDDEKINAAKTSLRAALDNLSSAGGSEPIMRAAGLYQTGTDTLIASWEDLINDGHITIEDGAICANVDDYLFFSGDLIIENDGSVTSIGDCAFESFDNLTNVIIPDSVTSIGYAAFKLCSSLTSITIPNSVTSIGDDAFSCCGLTSVIIPNNVSSIGEFAFSWCYNLTSVEIGDSVTTIGGGVFFECYSLTSVVVPDSVTTIGDDAFMSCTSLTNIEYAGTKAQWKSIEGNNTLSDSTDTIGNYIITCTDGTIAKDGTET